MIRIAVRILFLSLLAMPAYAENPTLSDDQDKPTIGDMNDGPMTVTVTGGGIVSMTGEVGSTIDPTGFVEVEGPLPISDTTIARAYTRIGITTVPGEDFDLTSVEKWRAAEAAIGVKRVIGRLNSGDQNILTSLVFEMGFTSRLGDVPRPKERLSRHYGGGVRVEERKSGASISILYGRDESAGDIGYGQIMVYGQVPITGTRGILVLAGDATVSPGPAGGVYKQRDTLRLGLVADLGKILGKLS